MNGCGFGVILEESVVLVGRRHDWQMTSLTKTEAGLGLNGSHFSLILLS